ncbi:MAG: hypothetical protein AB4057_02235 [Crocosphaera sp.]
MFNQNIKKEIIIAVYSSLITTFLLFLIGRFSNIIIIAFNEQQITYIVEKLINLEGEDRDKFVDIINQAVKKNTPQEKIYFGTVSAEGKKIESVSSNGWTVFKPKGKDKDKDIYEITFNDFLPEDLENHLPIVVTPNIGEDYTAIAYPHEKYKNRVKVHITLNTKKDERSPKAKPFSFIAIYKNHDN